MTQAEQFKRRAELNRLAEVFYKHDFFNDEKRVDESYCILSDIYAALSSETQAELAAEYRKAARRAELPSKQ